MVERMTTPAESTPLTVAELQRQLAAATTANATLTTRNSRLAELLASSRDKLKVMHAQLEEMAAPPSTYGTFIEFTPGNPTTAEIFTLGRRMRVAISPLVDAQLLTPGLQVRLGEGHQIVEAFRHTTTGDVATVGELIGTDRALVTDSAGTEHLLQLAETLTCGHKKTPRAGDTVLIDAKAGLIYEVIPKTEVARLALEEIPDVTYADIGGLDSQIEQIHDAVELPFAHPELYRECHLRPPKGVLLYGPPGCGKTLIAKAVANSLATRIGDGSASYFINVKGPELLNKFVGETERRIRLIFERARELAEDGRPVIVFFDEMESIFRTRGSGVSSDMETTVVPQLLTELDGVEGLSNVIVIGATNREELIDPAILRPGRLDVKIKVERPGRAQAKEIFARHLSDTIPLAPGTSIDELIDAATDYMYIDHPYVELTLIDSTTEVLHYRDFSSGAMIANIVDRAKKNAIKEHIAGTATGVTRDHLLTAVAAEFRESEDMPNTANPDEWSRILGRHGARVAHARVLGGLA